MLSRILYLSLAGVLCAWAVFASPMYHVTDLGSLGGNYTKAESINNLGQVTGADPWSAAPSAP